MLRASARYSTTTRSTSRGGIECKSKTSVNSNRTGSGNGLNGSISDWTPLSDSGSPDFGSPGRGALLFGVTRRIPDIHFSIFITEWEECRLEHVILTPFG